MEIPFDLVFLDPVAYEPVPASIAGWREPRSVQKARDRRASRLFLLHPPAGS